MSQTHSVPLTVIVPRLPLNLAVMALSLLGIIALSLYISGSRVLENEVTAGLMAATFALLVGCFATCGSYIASRVKAHWS